MNEIVENDRSAEGAVILHEPTSVKTNQEGCGGGSVVLRGDIDPVVPFRPVEDGAGPLVLGHLALRHSFLDLRIGSRNVVLIVGLDRGKGEAEETKDQEGRFHAGVRSVSGLRSCAVFARKAIFQFFKTGRLRVPATSKGTEEAE